MSKTITGIYRDKKAAELAVSRIIDTGVSRNDISLLMSEETQGREFQVEKASKGPEGATTGASVGGALGGIAAGLAAVGALSVPGLNLVAAGPIVGALAGVGAGGATGGLVGGLVGLGFTEHEAQMVREELENGGIVVGVVAHDDQASDAREILEDTGAKKIGS